MNQQSSGESIDTGSDGRQGQHCPKSCQCCNLSSYDLFGWFLWRVTIAESPWGFPVFYHTFVTILGDLYRKVRLQRNIKFIKCVRHFKKDTLLLKATLILLSCWISLPFFYYYYTSFDIWMIQELLHQHKPKTCEHVEHLFIARKNDIHKTPQTGK